MKCRLEFIRYLILFPTTLLTIYVGQAQSLDSLDYLEYAEQDTMMVSKGIPAPTLYYLKLVEASANRIALKYGAEPKTVEEYWQLICEKQYEIGVPAPVIMAIAIHESAFKSVLFQQSGNPFGIKAAYPWQGPTYSKPYNGIMTPFRAYSSPEEAVADFGDVIHSWWYADALTCPFDNFKCFVEGLKPRTREPGYNADPNWDKQVLRLIGENGLAPLCRR